MKPVGTYVNIILSRHIQENIHIALNMSPIKYLEQHFFSTTSENSSKIFEEKFTNRIAYRLRFSTSKLLLVSFTPLRFDGNAA